MHRNFRTCLLTAVIVVTLVGSCGGRNLGGSSATDRSFPGQLASAVSYSGKTADYEALDEYVATLGGVEEREDFLASYLANLLGPEADKQVQAPPTKERSKVTDLSYFVNTEGQFLFTWHYRNAGDYNQDGVASISDITPIAEHFFHRYNPDTGEWNDPMDEVVDGDGNLNIGIADITPLAENFFATVHGYVLEESTDDVNFSEVGRAEIADLLQPSEGRLLLAFNYQTPVNQAYYRVRPFQRGVEDLGIASDSVQYVAGASGILLKLVTPAESGDGTEASPFIILPLTPYELAVETLTGEDVSGDAEIFAEPPFFKDISPDVPRTLTVDDVMAGEFTVRASLEGDTPMESNTLWFRVEGGLPE